MTVIDHQPQRDDANLATVPSIIVSCDTHTGPRPEDLRPYCPNAYLDAFDEFIAASRRANAGYHWGNESRGRVRRHELNLKTAGHYDMAARLRDLDAEGVAAEVIFHGSQNDEPFPFGPAPYSSGEPQDAARRRELTGVGIQMYNRWLADFVSLEPERHVGLAQLPLWDLDAAMKELEWAAEHGLRGVNWPAGPRQGEQEYDSRSWEPFWSACVELNMHLNTHAGGQVTGMNEESMKLPGAGAIIQMEAAGWPARRAVHRMIFGGVFERHPDLTLVVSEQPGAWVTYALDELDSIWYCAAQESLLEMLPERPSFYFRRNIFVGASFMSSFEAEAAQRENYYENVLWGSDYPHREGTWAYRESPTDFNRSELALRDALAGVSVEAAGKMAGENAVRIFGLDRKALAGVAERIGAPTLQDLTRPLDERELKEVDRIRDRDEDYSNAFRKLGPWY
jgi:predicted TIM-barrel fold metal-dependent hydrolase